MHNKKIGLVYYSAALLGHKKITWAKACAIADRFTIGELTRIYLRISRTGTRRVYEKAS